MTTRSCNGLMFMAFLLELTNCCKINSLLQNLGRAWSLLLALALAECQF
jgi:hypothetical protein